MNQKTVFIGAGNMAEALLKGVIAGKIRAPADILLTDVRPDRLDELAEKYGTGGSTDNADAIADAGMVFLCVKPQQMDEVLRPLHQVNPEALWVSIAAGVPTARIEKNLGPGARVVRVMPNTPALVQKGAAGIAPGTHAMPADLDAVREIMESVGTCVVVDEEDLHAVTAISGSGPAYVFYLVEAMLKGAEKLGFDPDTARELAIQTVLGAGTLLQESGEAPEALRAKVTSKGGTTAAAVAAFDAAAVGEGITAGLLAAEARSRELAENG
ncbi:MAG: pyrroline-5-carboxylate reductase [Verrucomicrobia bacterium]|nr:pyrroline-5-carboxylate reductase [Verrucomicrobiota bacterium]MCH8512673.1 pyrroline-5-carboxylate reductase [Kiritimatiellia bacterium]